MATRQNWVHYGFVTPAASDAAPTQLTNLIDSFYILKFKCPSLNGGKVYVAFGDGVGLVRATGVGITFFLEPGDSEELIGYEPMRRWKPSEIWLSSDNGTDTVMVSGQRK